jgi:hypothetical protein
MIASHGYARVYFEKPWSKNHISVDLLGIQQAEEVTFRTTKARRDPSLRFQQLSGGAGKIAVQCRERQRFGLVGAPLVQRCTK